MNRKLWVRIALSAILLVSLLVFTSPIVKIGVESKGLLSLSADVKVFIGQPVQASAVVTTLGTAQDKASSATLDLSVSGVASGDFLFLIIAVDFLNQVGACEYYYDGVNTEIFTQDAYANNGGNVAAAIHSLKVTNSSSEGAFVRYNEYAGTPRAKAMTVYKVTGLADSPLDKTADNTGSGTDATVGPTATLSQADEVCFAATGVEDEIDDPHGTWTTGADYISGNEQFDATDGAGDASNVQVHSVAEIVSATTAQSGADTGHDDTDWAACIATYKIASEGEPSIENLPTSKDYGIVMPNSTYWSNGSEPSWPLADDDAWFTITNYGDQCSITTEATSFIGGTTWTLGTPAENVCRLTAFKEGDGSGDGKVLTGSPQAFISGLVTDIDWELKFETPTTFSFSDGVEKTSTITLTATLD